MCKGKRKEDANPQRETVFIAKRFGVVQTSASVIVKAIVYAKFIECYIVIAAAAFTECP